MALRCDDCPWGVAQGSGKIRCHRLEARQKGDLYVAMNDREPQDWCENHPEKPAIKYEVAEFPLGEVPDGWHFVTVLRRSNESRVYAKRFMGWA